MSVSRTVSEILSVKYWRDIEICVWGRSRSFKKIRLRPPKCPAKFTPLDPCLSALEVSRLGAVYIHFTFTLLYLYLYSNKMLACNRAFRSTWGMPDQHPPRCISQQPSVKGGSHLSPERSLVEDLNAATESVVPSSIWCSIWLVAWHSGRTSVFDRWSFPVLRPTCSWLVTTYVGKPSAVGQPTRPTQPFILSG